MVGVEIVMSGGIRVPPSEAVKPAKEVETVAVKPVKEVETVVVKLAKEVEMVVVEIVREAEMVAVEIVSGAGQWVLADKAGAEPARGVGVDGDAGKVPPEWYYPQLSSQAMPSPS